LSGELVKNSDSDVVVLGWGLKFYISKCQIPLGTWMLLEHGLFFELSGPTLPLWFPNQSEKVAGDQRSSYNLDCATCQLYYHGTITSSRTSLSVLAFLMTASFQARVESTLIMR
jgi:hypothetical protein